MLGLFVLEKWQQYLIRWDFMLQMKFGSLLGWEVVCQKFEVYTKIMRGETQMHGRVYSP